MSAEKLDNVATTRMALLETKAKIKLASHGHDLLKEKVDALINEFNNSLKEVKEAKSESEEALTFAHNQLKLAGLKLGAFRLREIGHAAPQTLELHASTRNIMGVKTPKLSIIQREISVPFYGSEFTSITLDASIIAFRKYIYSVINLAEKIATLQKLAYEIFSTKRRVNALNHIILPRLHNTAAYIELMLEEQEREEFSRMKFIKGRLEAIKQAK